MPTTRSKTVTTQKSSTTASKRTNSTNTPKNEGKIETTPSNSKKRILKESPASMNDVDEKSPEAKVPPSKKIRTTASTRATKMSELARQSTADPVSKTSKKVVFEEYTDETTREDLPKALTAQKKGSSLKQKLLASTSKTVVSNESSSSDTVEKKIKERALPEEYRALEEIFNYVEIACGFLEGRRQICTFEKLQDSVSIMCRRTLSREHLGQIKTIFPEGYEFKLMRNNLIILRTSQSMESKDEYSTRITSETELQRRRTEFHNRLFAKAYIKSENTVPASKSKKNSGKSGKSESSERLHETIIASDLPIPVSVDDTRKIAKKELLKKVLESPKKAQLEALMGQKKQQQMVVPQDLQDVSNDTINKVRLRQQKLEEESKSPIDGAKRRIELGRLPLLCENIRSFFSIENKNTMNLDILLEKLSISYSGRYSKEDLRTLVLLLTATAPNWCSIDEQRTDSSLTGVGNQFIKVDKKVPLSNAKAAIKQAIDNLSQHIAK